MYCINKVSQICSFIMPEHDLGDEIADEIRVTQVLNERGSLTTELEYK